MVICVQFYKERIHDTMKFLKLFIVTLGITLLASGASKTMTMSINTEKTWLMFADGENDSDTPNNYLAPKTKSIIKRTIL